MTRIEEQEVVVIDLGVASVETKGDQPDGILDTDEVLCFIRTGMSDD